MEISTRHNIISNCRLTNVDVTVSTSILPMMVYRIRDFGIILGQVQYADIIDCYATGNIDISYPEYNRSLSNPINMGCMGYANGCTIERCHTSVEWNIEGPNPDWKLDCVGGLVGSYDDDTNIDCLIKDCYATGNIYVDRGNAYATGGLFGYVYRNGGVIENCYAKLDQYWSNSTNASYLATFSGDIYGGYEFTTIIRNCYAEGNIFFVGPESSDGIGLFAAEHEGINLYNCYVKGDIDVETLYESYGNGLFAGNFYGDAVIEKCYAQGNVHATVIGDVTEENSSYNDTSGGFFGYAEAYYYYGNSTLVKDCYHIGYVTIDSPYAQTRMGDVGGFCGFLDMREGGIYTNCYSYGDVSLSMPTPSGIYLPYDVGGFIGGMAMNPSREVFSVEDHLYNSYSVGTVTAIPETQSVGGFIGDLYVYSPLNLPWSIENCSWWIGNSTNAIGNALLSSFTPPQWGTTNTRYTLGIHSGREQYVYLFSWLDSTWELKLTIMNINDFTNIIVTLPFITPGDYVSTVHDSVNGFFYISQSSGVVSKVSSSGEFIHDYAIGKYLMSPEIDVAGGYIYAGISDIVSEFYYNNYIARISLDDFSVTYSSYISHADGAAFESFYIDRPSGLLYTYLSDRYGMPGKVYKIDLDTMEVISSITNTQRVSCVVISSDSATGYFMSEDTTTYNVSLSKFDTSTMTVSQTIDLIPSAIAAQTMNIKIDPITGKLFCCAAQYISGNYVMILFRVNTDTMGVESSSGFIYGLYSTGCRFDFDSTYSYAIMAGDAYVYKVDTNNMSHTSNAPETINTYGPMKTLGQGGHGTDESDFTRFYPKTHPVYGGDIDLSPPHGSVVINNGDYMTTSRDVTLTVTATDNVAVSKIAFSNDDSTWTSWEDYGTTKSWTLDSGFGTKTVYVKFKDTSNNVSSSYSDTIIYVRSLDWKLENGSSTLGNIGWPCLAQLGSTYYFYSGNRPPGDVMSNSVYSSSDLISWTNLASAPWLARCQAMGCSFDNKIWIMGGAYVGTYAAYKDVWYSPNGTDWTQVADASWTPRQGSGCLVYDGKIWILGGVASEGVWHYKHDVYSSPNGVDWTMVTSGAPWSMRAWFGCTVYDGKMWVMSGGHNEYGSLVYNNEVWSSTDGVNWTQHSVPPWVGRVGFSLAVFNGKMWVFGGYNGNSMNDVWSTVDGEQWTQYNNADWSPRAGYGYWGTSEKVFVIGGDQGNYTYQADIWSSGLDMFMYGVGGDRYEDITDGGLNYRVHYFTTEGASSFVCPTGTGPLEVLVVGGGGALGYGREVYSYGGGGGGGEVVNNESYLYSNGESISVTVGSGGITYGFVDYSVNASYGYDGSASSFGSINASPGKVGPYRSGGQGGDSGNGHTGGSAHYDGSGGGGDSGNGEEGYGYPGDAYAGFVGQAGSGGNGTAVSITGSSVYYGGGGGGRSNSYVAPDGLGTGVNTGGGGGNANGSWGWSGVVIVRYVVPS